MFDDEHDELPLVSVGRGGYDLSNFSMPPADVLASQRAREQECERELRQLRELHPADDDTGHSEESQDTPSLCGESAREQGPAETEDGPTLLTSINMSDLIAHLLTHLPDSDTQFLRDYLEVLQQDSPAVLRVVNEQILCVVEAGLVEACKWVHSGTAGCGAWLCALWLAGGAAAEALRPRTRRALHALLQRATAEQLCEVSRAVCGAVESPRALLRLSDALRGPGGSARLADLLLQYALAQCGGEGAAAGEWRSITHVQAAGRCAAAGRPPPRRAAPSQRDHPDALKIAVAACRLDHLCRNNNNSSSPAEQARTC